MTTAELKLAKEKSVKKINCEFFFEKDSEFFFIRIRDNQFENYNRISVGKNTKEFLLNDFFYTEVINYSIYAYNSWELGGWIDRLFHKNDSYQIPIVINPKRESKDEYGWTAGVININNEQHLLKQRLLANILKPVINENRNFRKMGDNMIAVELELKEKEYSKNITVFENTNGTLGNVEQIDYHNENRKRYFWENEFRNGKKAIQFQNENSDSIGGAWNSLHEIVDAIILKFELNDNNIRNFYKYEAYLAYKVISVCEKYSYFKDTFLETKGENKRLKTEEFLDFIYEKNNRSHITNKLVQVINYIRFYEEIWKEFENQEIIDLDVLSRKLNKISKENDIPLIELLPPPIFDIDIRLSNEKDISIVTLDSLSSGEKQLIHSVSSIIYHLNNIDSVKKTSSTVKYDYVNLILEEIELYFHPEFQRKFVNYIVESINNANLNYIKGFNILFITHSPFILSDIPKQNVLFLEVGEDKKSLPKPYKGDNTFGENIHQMMTDGFFLGNTKGEIAISKINKFLEFYKDNIDLKEKPDNMDFDLENYSKIINLIGEDYIRKVLGNQLAELKSKFSGKSLVDIESEELIKRLKEINPAIKIDGI